MEETVTEALNTEINEIAKIWHVASKVVSVIHTKDHYLKKD